jgi:hypothetical protein
MSQTPVPRLDLAPKPKRPLSLWNPLDYLRLLYWVFYFPQALRWYVYTFAGGEVRLEKRGRVNLWVWLRENPIQRNLCFQGLLLTVITPVIIAGIFQQIGFRVNWFGIPLGVAIGVAIGVTGGIAFGVAFGVAFGIAFSMAIGVAFGMAIGVAFGMAIGVAFGIVLGMADGLTGGVAYSVSAGVTVGMAYGVAIGVIVGVAGVTGGVAYGVAYVGVASGVAIGVTGGVAYGVAILRPESWLFGIFTNFRASQNPNLLTRITPIPLPHMVSHINKWLQQDLEIGLHKINQLLAYTLQFIPVIKVVNRQLATTLPEEIIWYTSKFAENPFDWKLIHFASASLNNALKSEVIDGILFFPKRLKERLKNNFDTNTRLDTPARATAAGFWHLHEWEPIKAREAFAVVRSLPYGEEMYTLAHTIAIFHQTRDFSAIANINLETRNFPSSEPLLRPNTWQAINSCDRVIADAKVIQNSTSRASRAFALNRAIGELLQILDNPETIPEAERYLIIDIATTWKTALEKQTLEVGQVEITKPVTNPYIVGDPVEGQLFVGRDDIMRQLEELWLMGTNMQSVVLYGHRRMGKTSILRNLSQRVGAGVKIAYINLLGVGDVAHEGEVLMALSDAISQTVNIPPPNDEDLLNLPYRTFTRYLQRIIDNNVETRYIASLPENPTSNPKTPTSRGLIIALDEFEKIEELIAAGKIPQSFMGYLRSLVQMSPKIGFILAGLHTLEEMTADYFQPLYASFTPPIKVSFMEPDATSIILANPGIDDFPLDYTPEARDRIYQLTHGQPFLVQLVGFQLVRRYNDRTFAMRQKTNPIFTLDDVETVINDPIFFQRGRYYFDGVWSQALEGAAGQQTILQALAPYPQGLTIDELVKTTCIDVINLEPALQMLIRHDVVFEHQGQWQIIVELFRRWVLRL